jgi:hypothetical protein
MSIGVIISTVREAREEAIKDSLVAGKSHAEAQAAGQRAEAELLNFAASCSIRPLVWAATGAAVGSAIPVLGTGVGALIGYVGGTISAMVSPNANSDLLSAAKEVLK